MCYKRKLHFIVLYECPQYVYCALLYKHYWHFLLIKNGAVDKLFAVLIIMNGGCIKLCRRICTCS